MRKGIKYIGLGIMFCIILVDLSLLKTLMNYNKESFFIFLFLFGVSFNLLSQRTVIVNPPKNIKGIELKPLKINAYAPIIKLGETIVLSFDDLDGDEKNYSYSILHYTYDWKTSKIPITEYLNGLATDNIRDYSNAFNTYQVYTHYRLTIPNDRVSLKISGNYVLQVKDDNDDVVFSRKFMVYETKVTVGVSIHKSREIKFFNTHQNVQFTVNTNGLINNPRDEIKIDIYQNNDWNTLISNLKPQYYSGSQLIYKYADKSLFESSNEFLYFDTKNIRTATNNVYRSILKNLYNTYLYKDEIRKNKPYTFYPDIDGNFVIRNLSDETAVTEADYSWVHFSLDLPLQTGKSVYVYGSFNNWQINDATKMVFNNDTNSYEAKLLLKQGFYNYKYILKSGNELLLNGISGNFYQTENNYTVLVYFSEFGSRYDKLIGIGQANSKYLKN